MAVVGGIIVARYTGPRVIRNFEGFNRVGERAKQVRLTIGGVNLGRRKVYLSYLAGYLMIIHREVRGLREVNHGFHTICHKEKCKYYYRIMLLAPFYSHKITTARPLHRFESV